MMPASSPICRPTSPMRSGGAQRPAVVLGGGALAVEGVHGAALGLVETLGLVMDGWNGFNVVHLAAARMGALMLGFATQGGINAVAAAEPKLTLPDGRGTMSILANLPRATRSMSAIMATRGPMAPTWCCRALPSPRRTAPM